MYEQFEYIRGAIGSRWSKDRQYNGTKKRYRTNNFPQNYTQNTEDFGIGQHIHNHFNKNNRSKPPPGMKVFPTCE